MSNKDGGPAFPSPNMAGQTGLTIRDYFAAKAMQGMAADGSFIWSSPEEDAALCYKVADAMLAARESKP